MKSLLVYILEASTSYTYGEGLSAVDILKHFNGQKPISGTKSPAHGSMMPYTLIQKFFEIYNREFSSDASKYPFHFSKTGLIEIPIEYYKYADELKQVLDSSESRKRSITYEINATEFILKRVGEELHIKWASPTQSKKKTQTFQVNKPLEEYVSKVTMGSGDFTHRGDYQYAINVIKTLLLDNGEVLIGEYARGGKLTHKDFDPVKLKSLLDSIENGENPSSIEFDDCYIGPSLGRGGIWTKIWKGAWSGIGEDRTRKQEDCMCRVFNMWVKGENMDSIQQMLAGTIDSKWITSSINHCDSFRQFFKGDMSNFKMVRIDENDDVVSAWSKLCIAWKKLHKFRKIGHFDPTDVILYDTTKVSNVVAQLESIRGRVTDENWFEAIEEYRKFLQETNDYLPISLKDSSNGSHPITMKNMRAGENDNIKVNKVVSIGITVEKGKKSNNSSIISDPKDVKIQGSYIVISGTKYLLQDVHSIYSIIDMNNIEGVSRVRLEHRGSNGEAIVEVKPVEGKVIGPAWGKTSVNIWRRILGNTNRVTPQSVSNFLDMIKNRDDGSIREMIKDGAKLGNKRFPHAIFK